MSESLRIEGGTVLDGTYQLTRLIGKGGMGSVWEAQHQRLPKSVAIKVLKSEIADHPEAFARLRREAEVVSKLGHPHIVDALDFNTLPDGAPYLVLELLSGRSLRDRLKQGALSIEHAVTIVRQVASALHAAHQKEVVHRDLKPENIYLCEHEGQETIHVKILDFGLSRVLSSQSSLTHEGTIFGTPFYMSPEQASGKPADHRSDQWALGVIAYEMLTGRPPFIGGQVMEVLYQVVHEPPPALTELQPAIPAAAGQVITRALAKKPDERFEHVGDFAVELTHAAGLDSLFPSVGPVVAQATLPGRSSGGEVASAPTLPSSDLQAPDPALRATVLSDQLQGQAPRPASRRFIGAAIVSGAVLVLAVVAFIWWTRHEAAVSGKRATDATTTGPPDAARIARATLDSAPGIDVKRRVDAGRLDRAVARHLPKKGPAEKAPRKPKDSSVPSAEKLPAKLARRILQAERAFRMGRRYQARTLAERLLRDLPKAHRWRAHAILARVFCHNQDLTGFKQHIINVPGPARRRIRTYCRSFLEDL